MKFTARQQVLASLSHRQPDRVGVDLGATTSTGISAVAYNKLKRAMGLRAGHTRVFDVIQQLAIVEDELLDRFGVGVAAAGRNYDLSGAAWYTVELADGSEAQWPAYFQPPLREGGARELAAVDGTVIGRMPAGGMFFDQTHFPYAAGYPSSFANLRDDMRHVLWGACPRGPWQEAPEPHFWPKLQRSAEAVREQGRAVVLSVGCNLVEWGMFLRRMDNFLMDVYAEPDSVRRLVGALAEVHMATLKRAVEEVGDVVDVFRFGDDLGMDQGPLMSPAHYRDLFQPTHQRFCRYVKQHTQAFTCLHSCGSIYPLIPDLIDAGFDCLNPVQTSCRDMDPARLKREFGRDVTFWGGGCDTRRVLNRATPAEVQRHVLERLEILSPGGGFVFCTIHNILPEVPPENVIAMFEAVERFNGIAGG